MGVNTFYAPQAGTDVAEAFAAARATALIEYGPHGATGSLAEKTKYTVITRQPMAPTAAQAYAEQLIRDDDPRIDDKWGPAGAIPLADGRRTVTVPVPPDVYTTDREAIRAAVAGHDFGHGHPVDLPHMLRGVRRDYLTRGDYGSAAYRPGRAANRFRVHHGATIDITADYPATTHTGWLFFGWAPC